MKKIMVFSLIIVIIVIIILGLIYIYNKDNFKINEIDGVSLEIKEGTLSEIGATIVITDISNEKHIYGLEFKIQKLVNGKWKRVKTKNSKVVFPMVGYVIDENNKLEMRQNWEDLYGNLSKGTYRLIKSLSVESNGTKGELYFSVEFSI